MELLRIYDVNVVISAGMTLGFLGLCLVAVWWIFRVVAVAGATGYVERRMCITLDAPACDPVQPAPTRGLPYRWMH